MKMKIIIKSILLAYFSLFINCLYSSQISGKVIKVYDGDTIQILTHSGDKIKVRLYGIDCPEKAQPYGNDAKNLLSFLTNNNIVRVGYDKKGRYGRIIGKVYCNNVYVNKRLVKLGLAWHYKQYSKDKDLAKAEAEAKRDKMGLWKQNNPIPPWAWRRGIRPYKDIGPDPNSTLANKYSSQSLQNQEIIYKLNIRSNIRHN